MEAREILVLLDTERQRQGMTQAEWSRRAGYDEFGKFVSRAFFRGDCKLSTLVRLARPLGIDIAAIRKEGQDEAKP